MKKYPYSVFMILAAALVLLALSGCDQSGDDGVDPPPSSGRYESVEDLANLAGIETGGTYTVILGSSINISDSWGAINDAIYAAKKYVTLDLSACNAEEIRGNLEASPAASSNPSGNDFNIIRYNPYITGLILPENLKNIDNAALWDCISLGSVILPDGLLEIGPYSFYNCSSLKTLTLPDGLTSIGIFAFAYCSNLTGISIPDGIEVIERGAFSDCYRLASVKMPTDLTAIGGAFSNCSSLTSVTIPATVTAIETSAFTGCSSLATVVFEGSGTAIADNYSFYNGATLKTAYEGGGAGTYIRSGITWSKNP